MLCWLFKTMACEDALLRARHSGEIALSSPTSRLHSMCVTVLVVTAHALELLLHSMPLAMSYCVYVYARRPRRTSRFIPKSSQTRHLMQLLCQWYVLYSCCCAYYCMFPV